MTWFPFGNPMGRRTALRDGGPMILGIRVPDEKKPEPAEAAATAKMAAGCSGGDGAGDAGAIKL